MTADQLNLRVHPRLGHRVLGCPLPQVTVPKRQVSLFLAARHPGYATLRRYLVDEKFQARAGGRYWRSGGMVLPDAGT